MKLISHKTQKRIFSSVCGAILSVSFLLANAGSVLAAGPSLCAVTFGTNPDVLSTCSKAKNIPANVKDLLSGADGHCYAITVLSPAPALPSVAEKPCTDPPFNAYTPVSRNQDEFSSKICNNADDPSDKCLSKYISIATRFLAAGVGIVAIVMIIIGGIQYSSAGGDANKVAAARQKIFNVFLALVLFIFLFAFLQWLLPGGWI